jgi:DNA-binding transcriptional LysR family regulator
VNNDFGSFAMINRNLGFGIFPQMIVEKCGFPLVAVPLKDGYRTPISLGLRAYQKSSLATRAFVDYVRQWVEK